MVSFEGGADALRAGERGERADGCGTRRAERRAEHVGERRHRTRQHARISTLGTAREYREQLGGLLGLAGVNVNVAQQPNEGR